MAVMVATDFFTVEVLTLRGLITYYVLFFIHLESRRICLAGVTRHPDQEWMEQMARNVTMEDSGFLINRRLWLAKTSYTCKMNNLAQSSIRTFPI